MSLLEQACDLKLNQASVKSADETSQPTSSSSGIHMQDLFTFDVYEILEKI